MKSALTYLSFLAMLLVAGCAHEQTARPALPSVSGGALDSELLVKKKDAVRTVMETAEKRNREIEETPEWITGAYHGIRIKKLNDLAPAQYAGYRKYVDNGAVYIIVHPAYYLFFHAKKPPITRDQDDPSDSIVDVFLAETFSDPVIRLEQQQQKNEKRFIEYLTTAQKLVILVLPRDYQRSANYVYGQGPDEYARYLNEIANDSPSILYLESETSSSGKLLSADLIPLLSFLEATDAASILVGGGYVGRCQKEFYHYVTHFAVTGTYAIVPEISTFSPEDVSGSLASRFLDGTANSLQPGAEFVLQKTAGNAQVQHLPLYYMDAILHVSEGRPRAELTLPLEESKALPASTEAPLHGSKMTAPAGALPPDNVMQDYSPEER